MASLVGKCLNTAPCVTPIAAAMFAGGSTGLNVVAAIELAAELGPGKRVVTLGCDNGSKYLGGHIYRTSDPDRA